MHASLSQSNQSPSQQLEQIIKLKVQLTKHKSKLQGYKEIQNNYKKISIKSEVMEKQLSQYQKIMETFFQRLNKLMALLNIDYVSIFGAEGGVNSSNTAAMNESSEKVNDSISFINLNPPLISGDPTLMRRINKLNSLRSISKQYLLGSKQIQFTHQEAKFHLIESSIRSLVKSNEQYQTTLQKYQKSSLSIQLNTKQQQVIVKRLESQLRMKDKEIQQRDCQINELLKNIATIKQELNQKQQTIDKLQKQQLQIIKTYEELQFKIHQLNNQNTQEQQTKNNTRAKCHQLIQNLKLNHSTYLKNYLLNQTLILKHSQYPLKSKNFYTKPHHQYQFTLSNQKQSYSQTGKQKYHPRNKHEFVFD